MPSRSAVRFAAFRARFRPIFIAPLLVLVTLLAWSMAAPMGSSPDDDYHLDSIWCGNPLNTDACQQGREPASRIVPTAVFKAPCFAQQPDNSAECLYAYLADADATSDTQRGNFYNQYPPVYYAAMSLFVGPDIQGSIFLMRVVNVLLFIGLTTALAFLLPVRRRQALIVGWVITTIPLAAFLLGSNNPSSWAIIGVGSAWIALVGYFESTGRRKIALGALFVISAVMAAGSRTDAAFYTVIGIALAIWLTFRRDRAYLLSAILPLVLAAVAVFFYLNSTQSSVAVGGLTTGGTIDQTLDGTNAPRDLFGLIAYNLLQAPLLWVGVFGLAGLGWLDTPVPAVVWVGAAAAFVVTAFTGILKTHWRELVAIVGLALALWIIPTYVLVKGGNIVGQNVQPRYLLPLIVVLGMLMVLPLGARLLPMSLPQLLIIGSALAIANAFALHTNIRRYVTGIDVPSANLDKGVEWWWPVGPSPMTTWIIGTLAYAGLLAVLIWEVRKRGSLRHDVLA